jgi:hypothetical protein
LEREYISRSALFMLVGRPRKSAQYLAGGQFWHVQRYEEYSLVVNNTCPKSHLSNLDFPFWKPGKAGIEM